MRFPAIFTKNKPVTEAQPTPDLSQLRYNRKHQWGNKLLDKLSPQEKQDFLRSDGMRKKTLLTFPKKTETSRVRDEEVEAAAKDGVSRKDNKWIVPDAGAFSKRAFFAFTGTQLPTGLSASDNAELNSQGPYKFRFDPVNVKVADGVCKTIIPGGQDATRESVSCGEITTDEHKILHASVRFYAAFSAVKGSCHGAFFYHSDQHECDIEYLTDPASTSNGGGSNSIPLWYSNQAVVPGLHATNSVHPAPSNISEFHEYRIDWTSDFTAFYVDGILQKKLTSNIPMCPGMWVFNNWANGNPDWSLGPPKEDCIFQIKNITMYYNVASDFRAYQKKSRRAHRP